MTNAASALIGACVRIFLKKGASPHRFDCSIINDEGMLPFYFFIPSRNGEPHANVLPAKDPAVSGNNPAAAL